MARETLQLGRLIKGQALQQGSILGLRAKRVVVEARNGHLAVGALDGRHRPQKVPRGGRDVAGIGGVLVVGEHPAAELDVEEALAPVHQFRPALVVDPPALPHAVVGLEAVGVCPADLLEVQAPRLLLALDEELDLERQLAENLPVGLQGTQPRHEVALVVGDAPGKDAPVPLRRR